MQRYGDWCSEGCEFGLLVAVSGEVVLALLRVEACVASPDSGLGTVCPSSQSSTLGY